MVEQMIGPSASMTDEERRWLAAAQASKRRPRSWVEFYCRCTPEQHLLLSVHPLGKIPPLSSVTPFRIAIWVRPATAPSDIIDVQGWAIGGVGNRVRTAGSVTFVTVPASITELPDLAWWTGCRSTTQDFSLRARWNLIADAWGGHVPTPIRVS